MACKWLIPGRLGNFDFYYALSSPVLLARNVCSDFEVAGYGVFDVLESFRL